MRLKKMQTRQVVALVIVIAIIALPFGATTGYNLFLGRITTYTVCCNSNVYDVEFIQQAATCPPSIPMYVAPWSVTLGNQSKTEPSNETELGGIPVWGPSYSAYSEITFFVPNGVYNYSASPDNNGYTPFQDGGGMVTVSGSNVTVNVG